MKKVVDYTLISGIKKIGFSEQIMEMIGHGYEPLGAPFVFALNGRELLFQAMVKYEDKEADNMKRQQAHMREKFKMMEKIKAKDLKHEDEA